MGLRDFVKGKPAEAAKEVKPKTGNLELSKAEIEILLNGLADCTFTGRQLDLVYRLVIKLQNEHKKLS